MCIEKCGSIELSPCEHERAFGTDNVIDFNSWQSNYGRDSDAQQTAGKWQRRGKRLAVASALLTGSLGLVGASQAAAADCVDSDGDGYGWNDETQKTCFLDGGGSQDDDQEVNRSEEDNQGSSTSDYDHHENVSSVVESSVNAFAPIGNPALQAPRPHDSNHDEIETRQHVEGFHITADDQWLPIAAGPSHAEFQEKLMDAATATTEAINTKVNLDLSNIDRAELRHKVDEHQVTGQGGYLPTTTGPSKAEVQEKLATVHEKLGDHMCVDPDGDGWGWIQATEESCRTMPGLADFAGEMTSKIATLAETNAEVAARPLRECDDVIAGTVGPVCLVDGKPVPHQPAPQVENLLAGLDVNASNISGSRVGECDDVIAGTVGPVCLVDGKPVPHQPDGDLSKQERREMMAEISERLAVELGDWRGPSRTISDHLSDLMIEHVDKSEAGVCSEWLHGYSEDICVDEVKLRF